MDSKTKDFVFSIFLMLLGFYVFFEGMRIYERVSGPPRNIEKLYLSPGFLPIVLGAALALLSLLLLIKTLKDAGGEGYGIRSIAAAIGKWAKNIYKDPNALRMTVGVAIMWVYSYFMIRPLGFIVASLLFMVAIMLFLRSTGAWKILLISGAAIALIFVLFELVFGTSLPLPRLGIFMASELTIMIILPAAGVVVGVIQKIRSRKG